MSTQQKQLALIRKFRREFAVVLAQLRCLESDLFFTELRLIGGLAPTAFKSTPPRKRHAKIPRGKRSSPYVTPPNMVPGMPEDLEHPLNNLPYTDGPTWEPAG